ncbi:MAG: LysM peptidoglycan-binding domain-containing protein [Gemmatimonadetes bacterium]|nr:LysM peptidoglycan-binding domain-containing protein [Gemmatimonadota bacterium]
MLQEKYRAVLQIGESINVKDGYVKEEDGKLKIGGTVPYAYDKDRLWDAIKQQSGWESEVEADIDVANTDVYGVYEVVSGDTLWKVSEKLYGKGNLYMKIFEANKDQLDNPDRIKVGQKLKMPNP